MKEKNKEGKKMKWEHFTFEERKLIHSMLCHKAKLNEIAEILGKDPTSVSKEIKRNRFISKDGIEKPKMCVKVLRYPYVCNACTLKYTTCPFAQFKYDAKKSQEKANHRLISTRIGLNIDKESFDKIDACIKEGVSQNQSIYHIVHSHDEITVSVPTIYRWIKEKKLTTKWLDLPYAKTYKVRNKKKYDYSSNKMDRSNRTYLDYLEYRRSFPGDFGIQMDFLGTIISDSKSILTLTIPEFHFVYIRILEKVNQNVIVSFFNDLEDALGIYDFKRVFSHILTDRDPCFTNFLGIEFSPITGEQRTRIFYCDSFKSSQKGNVENMNRQLRKYMKKGHSMDSFTQDDIKQINQIIINTKIASLGGFTPKEAFIKTLAKIF